MDHAVVAGLDLLLLLVLGRSAGSRVEGVGGTRGRARSRVGFWDGRTGSSHGQDLAL